jgi:hypothetical protein
MNPTLCGSDLLEIVPYGERTVRLGDVTVFQPPEEKQRIVHRVISITSKGIHTRGDNNTSNDPWLLKPENITGKVVAAWHGQKRRRIVGGWTGWLLALLNRWRCSFTQHLFFPLLRPIYRFLIRLSMIPRLLPSQFRPRIVIFQANGHSYPRLLLGKRVVGWYNVKQGQWHIRQPFHLFVNLKNLQNLSGI